MNNKYCPSCGKRLAVNPGDRAAEFKVITVQASNRNAAQRKEAAEHKGLKMRALEWVVNGFEPPPAYKPATVVGRHSAMTSAPLVNMLTGRYEYLLVRNDPGSLMRRLLGMLTMRVCTECYDEKFKAHPQQLQKAEATAPSRNEKLLGELRAKQNARSAQG